MRRLTSARSAIGVLTTACFVAAACGGRADARGWGGCAQWNDDPKQCAASSCHYLWARPPSERSEPCVGDSNGVFLAEPGCFPREDCTTDGDCAPQGRCIALTVQPCETTCYRGMWCALVKVCQPE